MHTPSILAIIAAAALTTLPAARLQAQAPPAADPNRPAFEAASIKRNVSASDNASIRALPGGRVTVTNNSLRNIVRNAYRLQNFQIAGGPDWINTDRWDIVAKAEGDTPPPQMLLMVRTLLADRFKLVVHTEMRDAPVFALVVARSDGQLGAQLRRSSVDCAALFAAAQARKEAPPNAVNGRPACGTQIRAGIMMTTGTTMADLARSLSALAGRSVVDKTGLTGGFDLDLTWAPDQIPQPEAPGATPAAPSDSPSLFTAIQEQLGLKLDSQRTPIETLVIDSAQRPTED